MPIGISPEHHELATTTRRWLDAHCPSEKVRTVLDGVREPIALAEIADQGWLGLHVPEEYGGQGYGLAELAVVLEELGKSLLPGPALASMIASAAIGRSANSTARKAILPALVDGSASVAVRCATNGPAMGTTGAVWTVTAEEDGKCVVLEQADLHGLDPLDPTLPMVDVTGGNIAFVLDGVSAEDLDDLAMIIFSATLAGSSRWCLETTSAYAKDRVQFGRPIGQFQGVKHKLADMLVTVEQLDAIAWDGALAADGGESSFPLAAAIAGSIGTDGALFVAKSCVQLLGGIGFTWEHDAHMYLRRALAARAILGEGSIHASRVTELATGGMRRSLSGDLPEAAEAIRMNVRPLVEKASSLEGVDQRRYLADEGLIAPHWPEPWGRGSAPLEQLVWDEELAKAHVHRPGLAVGAWALPTIIAHGTEAQQQRWVRPTLRGEITWCQLFSEPGAGSDLANLSTRAERGDGCWILNGQKVWTSLAHVADFGICLARTDPSVPKHDGITYFIVDMKASGLDVRPLRELTGDAMFNEVFLVDVVVPDDCVIGSPGEGWKIGRTTLANERVSMSSGSTFGIGIESVLKQFTELGSDIPAGSDVWVGHLVAEAQSVRLMGHRATLRSLSGTDPGAGSSVRKLLGAEHEQRIQEAGLTLQGPRGAVAGGDAARWSHGFLMTRCLTIAGGTSEVQRNVMAERILGQPRDP